MAILSNNELRNQLSTQLLNRTPYNEHIQERIHNWNAFCNLNEIDLATGVIEKRVKLYTTLNGEIIYYQYPGRDANNASYRFDGRPVLIKSDGNAMRDLNFREIWRTFEQIAANHNLDLDILGTLLVIIGYMKNYTFVNCDHDFQTIDMTYGPTTIIDFVQNFSWYKLNLNQDIIETLNDRFGLFEGVSFEGILYYIDLIAQNEDCKYFCDTNANGKRKGRINNVGTHLTVVSYLRGRMSTSDVLDAMQRSGVAPLPLNRIENACGDLVDII